MPQTNRGKEGSDDRLFGSPVMIKKMQQAIFDLSFLLDRGYASKSSKELIGNRYKLNQRQIKAVAGMSASKKSVALRKEKQLTPEQLKDQTVFLDGFNVLIVLESILSQAYIFRGMEGAYRDLSSVHSSYKKVSQTETALLSVQNDILFISFKEDADVDLASVEELLAARKIIQRGEKMLI